MDVYNGRSNKLRVTRKALVHSGSTFLAGFCSMHSLDRLQYEGTIRFCVSAQSYGVLIIS